MKIKHRDELFINIIYAGAIFLTLAFLYSVMLRKEHWVPGAIIGTVAALVFRNALLYMHNRKRRKAEAMVAPAEERYVPQVKTFYIEGLQQWGWECRPWCAEEFSYQMHFSTKEDATRDGNRHAERYHKNNWTEGSWYGEDSS